MSAPIDRKGNDVRKGKRAYRLMRDELVYERNRLSNALESGASPVDVALEIRGPWLSDYEANHIS